MANHNFMCEERIEQLGRLGTVLNFVAEAQRTTISLSFKNVLRKMINNVAFA